MKVISGFQWHEEVGRGTWAKVKRVICIDPSALCQFSYEDVTNHNNQNHLSSLQSPSKYQRLRIEPKQSENLPVEGREYAVKIYYNCKLARKIRNGLQLLYQEFSLVNQLNHPNIIKYIHLDDKSNPEKIYLFMEYCSNGNLLQCMDIQPISPNTEEVSSGIAKTAPLSDLEIETIRNYFYQLLEALQYLHASNVAHHDVKPENVLINSEGIVKLADFGVAEQFDPLVGCTVFYGTPAYQSPEIVANVTGEPFDGSKADMWAAGVLLYQLVTHGSLPFWAPSVYLLMQAVETFSIDFPHSGCAQLDHLLQALLNRNPVERLSASDAIAHSFFANHHS